MPRLKKAVLAATLLLILVSALVVGIIVAFPDYSPAKKNEPTQPPNHRWSQPARISDSVSRYLCMSADGKKLAYLDTYDLFLMNSDGTGVKQLTHYEKDGLVSEQCGASFS